MTHISISSAILYRSMLNIHRLGIYHGDLAPRNVVLKHGKLTWIDFDCSDRNHQCLGERCQELQILRSLLQPGDYSWCDISSLCRASSQTLYYFKGVPWSCFDVCKNFSVESFAAGSFPQVHDFSLCGSIQDAVWTFNIIAILILYFMRTLTLYH